MCSLVLDVLNLFLPHDLLNYLSFFNILFLQIKYKQTSTNKPVTHQMLKKSFSYIKYRNQRMMKVQLLFLFNEFAGYNNAECIYYFFLKEIRAIVMDDHSIINNNNDYKLDRSNHCN